MTATAAAVERKALGEYKDLDLIDTSPLNPRKTFDQARLEEMRDSIKQVGIIEPLVVRPGKADRVEVVAGERRFRASKMAGLREVPVIVRYLTDSQVLELMAIENEQREDVHPLERAAGYQALMKADPKFTPDVIANRIGKSPRWVQLNLQYLTLVPEAKDAFLKRGLTSGHADLLVRLNPEDQLRALKAGCFSRDRVDDDDPALSGLFPGERSAGNKKDPGVETPVSVRSLAEWIQSNVRLSLDAKSGELTLFPDLQAALAKPGAAGGFLALYDAWYYHRASGEKHPPLTTQEWRRAEGKKCEFVERGVIVVGRGRGQLVDVCRAKGKCRAHWGDSMAEARTASTSKPRVKSAAEKRFAAQMTERRQQASLWSKIQPQAVKLVSQKIAQLKPGPVAYQLLAGELYCHKKNPTLQDLLAGVVDNAKGDAEQFQDLAKPLGVDLKPLFAAAAPPKKPAQTAAAKKPAAKKGAAERSKKSAAARKAISARMKKYWASRAAKKGRK